jgi:hypothetical protein
MNCACQRETVPSKEKVAYQVAYFLSFTIISALVEAVILLIIIMGSIRHYHGAMFVSVIQESSKYDICSGAIFSSGKMANQSEMFPSDAFNSLCSIAFSRYCINVGFIRFVIPEIAATSKTRDIEGRTTRRPKTPEDKFIRHQG